MMDREWTIGGIENRSTPTLALVGDGAGTKININIVSKGIDHQLLVNKGQYKI